VQASKFTDAQKGEEGTPGLAEVALGADLPAAGLEELVQVLDDRTAALVADVTTLVSG